MPLFINRIRLSLLLALFILMGSCAKWEDLSWDVDLSAPLLKTKIDLGDILPDSMLASDCQNWVYIDYRQQVFELTQDTLFDLGQSITSLKFNIPATVNMNPGQSFVSSQEETKFNFQDAELSKIKIDSGLVTLKLTNSLKEKVVCVYSLPGSARNGTPFTARVVIPAAVGSQPGMVETDADISGYLIDLRGQSGFASNRIRVKIDAFIDSAGSTVQVTPFDTLTINALFKSLTLSEAYGYFGRHHIATGTKSSRIKTFDLFNAGQLSIDSAIATLMVSNGTGMDIRLNFNDMKVRNTKTGASVSVNDPFMRVPVNISRATINSSTGFITPVEHAFRFDHATMKSMFEIFPDYLDYDLDFEINPLGNVSFGNDFLLSESPLKAWFELLIPMSFAASDLTFRQDVEFYFESANIQEGKLFLIADNRFPFDARISLKLKDESGVVIDSLLPAGIVDAALLPLPDLVQSVRTIIAVPCDPQRIARLRETRSIALEVVLNTKPVGSMVRLRSDYDMHVVISTNLKTTLVP
jgi:hypothetical protein